MKDLLHPLLLSLALLFFLSSSLGCGHVFLKKSTYEQDKTNGAEVNGATIFSELEPVGGDGGLSLSAMVYFAGSAKLEGPFDWSIVAHGNQGEHQTLRINAVNVRTEKTKRNEWFPKNELGIDCKFKPSRKNKGKAIAKFKFPGTLEVNPEQDGKIFLTVDLTVISSTRRVDSRVRFELQPCQKNEVDFIFVPGELIQSINAGQYAD